MTLATYTFGHIGTLGLGDDPYRKHNLFIITTKLITTKKLQNDILPFYGNHCIDNIQIKIEGYR